MIMYVFAMILMGCGLVISSFSDYCRYDQIVKLSIRGKEFLIDRSVTDVGFGRFYAVNLNRFCRGSRVRGRVFSLSYNADKGFVLERNASFINIPGRGVRVENSLGEDGQDIILGPDSKIIVFFEEEELEIDLKIGV